MHGPNQQLMPKIPVFNLNAGSISANHKQYLKSHTFNTGTPDGWSTAYGPHCTAGDPEAQHPSKPRTDSFPFTNTTAGLPTEEQLHGTKLKTFINHLVQNSCAASQMLHEVKQCLQSDVQLLSVGLATRQLLAVLCTVSTISHETMGKWCCSTKYRYSQNGGYAQLHAKTAYCLTRLTAQSID